MTRRDFALGPHDAWGTQLVISRLINRTAMMYEKEGGQMNNEMKESK